MYWCIFQFLPLWFKTIQERKYLFIIPTTNLICNETMFLKITLSNKNTMNQAWSMVKEGVLGYSWHVGSWKTNTPYIII